MPPPAQAGVGADTNRVLKALEHLKLKLSKIYVPPYVRPEADGTGIVHVKGYWREGGDGSDVTRSGDIWNGETEGTYLVYQGTTAQGNTSAKFWSAQQLGPTVAVRWGKLGSVGQTKTFDFTSTAEAHSFVTKKMYEKLDKGYDEVAAPKGHFYKAGDFAGSVNVGPIIKKPATPKPLVDPKPTVVGTGSVGKAVGKLQDKLDSPAVLGKGTLAPSTQPKEAPAVSSAPIKVLPKQEFDAPTSHFEYHSDAANSHKFWEITVQDKTATVTYGSTLPGKKPQSKSFSFDSPGEAHDYAEKKKTEKLVKGYKEMIDPAVPPGLETNTPLDVTSDVGIPDHVAEAIAPPAPPAPSAPVGGGSHTGVTKNKDELIQRAKDLGIAVDPNWSKVEIMDAIRAKTGSFDPKMEVDPMKAKDLQSKIDWSADDPYSKIEEYLTDDWIAEPKLDGARFRMFLGTTGNSLNTGRRSSVTMAYTDRTENFPQFADLVVPELAGTVLDGELMPPVDSIDLGGGNMTQGSLNTIMSMVNINPKDSQARQKKYGKAIFVVFDVLTVKGEDVTKLPLEQRRKMLEMIMNVLQAREPAMQIALQMPANKESIKASLDQGMEGVMLKKKDSAYIPGGRPNTWQKVKSMSTGDFYIIGSVPGKGSNAGKVGSLKVAYRGKDGEDVYVADVAGFDQKTREAMTDPNTGDVKESYLGKVIEVRGQGRTKGDRIRHPVFMRWRDDKTPEDTDITQFHLFPPT